jgi:hypothetical protein
VTATGCQHAPPDRWSAADQLTAQIRTLPGVAAASPDYADSYAAGNVHFWLSVDVTDGVTAEQVADIAAHYLDGLHAVDYSGYDTELVVQHGWNVFAVESGQRAVTNTDQIVGQARDWVALRREFPRATVRLRASIAHSSDGSARADRGHPSLGTIDTSDADYTAVSSAVATLGTRFPQLSTGNWTISASNTLRTAEITTAQRLPTAQELSVWDALNTDQSTAHADAMTINPPQAPPMWISEKVYSHAPADALALAERHLPIVAALTPPLLYTATDQLQGRRDFNARTTGPVAVTIGGCTTRTYRPDPPEQRLIATYERCRS